MVKESKTNTEKEAKFWKDKHLLETNGGTRRISKEQAIRPISETWAVGKGIAGGLGITPENYDKIKRLEEEEDKRKEELDKKLSKELNIKINLEETFNEILEVIDYYVDMEKDSRMVFGLWILGSHFYKKFPTFPILFFNAMKGSGKTRALGLASHLSIGLPSKVQNNITESALFHSKDSLFLDEMEKLNSKDEGRLKYLLNSCYKKGAEVTRMAKKKSEGTESYVPETFDLYRPVSIANISGLDSILEDRALIILLEKSFNRKITSRIEDFDKRLVDLKKKLKALNSDSSDGYDSNDSNDSIQQLIDGWNPYIDSIPDLTVTTVTAVTPSPFDPIYNAIFNAGINGRTLELTFPLMILSNQISPEVFKQSLEIFSKIDKKRREDEFDSLEILVYQFVSSQNTELNEFKSPTDLFNKFQVFVNFGLDMKVNAFSKLLNKLKLIKDRRRTGVIRLIKLDIEKAKTKLGLFEGAKK